MFKAYNRAPDRVYAVRLTKENIKEVAKGLKEKGYRCSFIPRESPCCK